MTEELNSGANATEATPSLRARVLVLVQLIYIFALSLLTLILLVSRTQADQFLTDGPLLFLFLLISTVAGQLSFSVGPYVTADLAGLFNGAAVLTLGFNGVWVALLANLYWVLNEHLRDLEYPNVLSRIANILLNLSLTALPSWLGLFVYHDLLGGALPLTDLATDLVPALAFVIVRCVAFPAGLLLPAFAGLGGTRGIAGWFKSIMVGFTLSVYGSTLFSLAVAVILNRLGTGFFLFVTAGLLGVSLMAQRLARSLEAERRRVAELTALNALSDDILHNPPGVEVTGDLLVRHAPQFMPDADFQLCLLDARAPERRQVMVDWREGAARPASEATLTPLWAWLREKRQPLHAADLAQASLPFAWDDEGDGSRPGSLLLVPLLAGDPNNPEGERCLGGILTTHRRREAFDQALPSMNALAHQLAAALENARLYQAALARERMERELVLARGIQTSFLPAEVPQIPGWTFAASLEPARHVSGDFYDFIPLPRYRLGVLIADVADKGMPAALYMALTRTLIRAHAPDYPDDPATCLWAVNDQILTDTQADSFVTVFYGILNTATGEMPFANAGHNPPYLCRRNGSEIDPALAPLPATGMPLGIMPDMQLADGRTHFTPGDYLVLYTDGVTEAHNLDLAEFGEDRLLAEITRPGDASVQAIQRGVRNAIDAFVGDAPQFDDLTLVMVERDAAE